MIDRMQGNNSPCGVIRMRCNAVCIAGASRSHLVDVTLQSNKTRLDTPIKISLVAVFRPVRHVFIKGCRSTIVVVGNDDAFAADASTAHQSCSDNRTAVMRQAR
jgi:hypothetical protein